MTIAKNKIIETRKKLEQQKAKDEARLKALRLKLKKANLKIREANQKEEMNKKIILGNLFLQKAKRDDTFKVWLEGEIVASDLPETDKALFKSTKDQLTDG